MPYIIAAIAICCLIIGWLLRTLWFNIHSEPSGTLNVVEWPDGTTELLLSLDDPPEKFRDHEALLFFVKKTRG